MSDGSILIIDVDRAILTTGNGDTARKREFEHCLMLGAYEKDSGVRVHCRLDTAKSRWEVETLNKDLKTIATVRLDGAATGYNFVSAQSMPDGWIAVGGQDQHQQGNALIFEAAGSHIATHRFPDGNTPASTQDRVLNCCPHPKGS